MKIVVKRSDSLAHKRGEEREDHKYIKREWKGGKWIYYYPEEKTNDLFDSDRTVTLSDGTHVYPKKGKISQAADSVKGKLGAIKNKVSQLFSKPFSENSVKRGEDFVANTLKDLNKSNDIDDKKTTVDKESQNKNSTDKATDKKKTTDEKTKQEIIDMFDDKNAKSSDTDSKQNTRKKSADELSDKDIIDMFDTDEDKESVIDNVKKLVKNIFDKNDGTLELDLAFTKEQRRQQQEEREKTEVLDELSDLKQKNRQFTPEEDMKEVNPYYDPSEAAYSQNCAYCTAAYDMRKRGYDVEARMRGDDYDSTIYDMLEWYDGAELVSVHDILAEQDPSYKKFKVMDLLVPRSTSFDDSENTVEENAKYIEQDLLKHGEGARGFFNVYWTGGGAHAIAWEVTNGKVVLRDTQLNQVHDMEQIISMSSNMNYIRVDNLEPSQEIYKTIRNK